jgi:hypothetical protein
MEIYMTGLDLITQILLSVITIALIGMLPCLLMLVFKYCIRAQHNHSLNAGENCLLSGSNNLSVGKMYYQGSEE